jgi:phosphohistidine phosphatase
VKTVLVFRHGKSDWDADFGRDHDRPLAKRGVEAAKTMGRWLTRVGQVPDQIYTSSAVRAHDTVQIAVDAGKWPSPVDVRPELYEASPGHVLKVIRKTADRADRVLIAGHEPTCSELVAKLTGGSDVKFPTAALARIDFPVARWTNAAFGEGTLVWFVVPRLLEKTGV